MNAFPFLFGGTFIEAPRIPLVLSSNPQPFPFLFGGTFIEALKSRFKEIAFFVVFPFLFGGTFIEAATAPSAKPANEQDFPSFSEGLSLRLHARVTRATSCIISLPFRRDFH